MKTHDGKRIYGFCNVVSPAPITGPCMILGREGKGMLWVYMINENWKCIVSKDNLKTNPL